MLDLDLYEAKKLYPFQEKTVSQVLDELRKNGANFNLLYQLPTGGGKTVIFSAIAKRYIEESGKKVLILTHRIELSIQTSKLITNDKLGSRFKYCSVTIKRVKFLLFITPINIKLIYCNFFVQIVISPFKLKMLRKKLDVNMSINCRISSLGLSRARL